MLSKECCSVDSVLFQMLENDLMMICINTTRIQINTYVHMYGHMILGIISQLPYNLSIIWFVPR